MHPKARSAAASHHLSPVGATSHPLRADTPRAAAIVTTAPSHRRRVHWVIAELDARGEIDAHAAMCLSHAIAAVQSSVVTMVLVDLRDLAAIDPAGLALFRARRADCAARGMELGLLISGRERHYALAEAFVLAGLGSALHYTG